MPLRPARRISLSAAGLVIVSGTAVGLVTGFQQGLRAAVGCITATCGGGGGGSGAGSRGSVDRHSVDRYSDSWCDGDGRFTARGGARGMGDGGPRRGGGGGAAGGGPANDRGPRGALGGGRADYSATQSQARGQAAPSDGNGEAHLGKLVALIEARQASLESMRAFCTLLCVQLDFVCT